ncbi:MarR family transcriptional regulator (plasmid) [Haloferax sp. S1W]|uniref:helix-turn-helix transcriptional regulator n=1 Tax=Haloferax sp. S1W TaxID=3377110 RepID=UPI0037C69EEF
MATKRVLFVLSIFVLAAFFVPTSVAASPSESEQGTIIEGEFTDNVSVEQTGGSTYLWESEPNTLKVTFNATNESNLYKLCVQNEEGERIGCQDKSASEGSQTVTFEYENLSAFKDSSTATVVLWNNYPGQSERLDSGTVNITVIEKDGDIDGDKLTNANELSNNTSMFLMDTDEDSLEDGAEVKNYGTSPTSADTDNDNLSDAMELSNSLSPVDADTDDDGIPDGVEIQLGTPPKDPTADTDNDGLRDSYEYAHNSNPVVADTDGDGLDDGLETKLGTKVNDAGTTPLLLFAGGTLFGVATVGTRWLRVSESYPFEELLPSRLAGVLSSGSDETDDDSTGTAETNAPPASQEFDQQELLQSSKPILSDEDKVIQLLRENGGWVYQSKIVENNNWSKSKVSRLLSRMSDEGMVEKISVGRQNIVAEEGSMPEGVGSPLDK